MSRTVRGRRMHSCCFALSDAISCLWLRMASFDMPSFFLADGGKATLNASHVMLVTAHGFLALCSRHSMWHLTYLLTIGWFGGRGYGCLCNASELAYPKAHGAIDFLYGVPRDCTYARSTVSPMHERAGSIVGHVVVVAVVALSSAASQLLRCVSIWQATAATIVDLVNSLWSCIYRPLSSFPHGP